ncbi:MAG TPA: carbon storage regulator CsrA [Candidatus Kapabacteria bacterium]|nr:carbon storage regulator CsrA [Candidatus Kapabacteria bacterium]
MLILTRKKDQSIVIGNNIEIKILKVNKNSVELGISAPKTYSIFREEVFREIQEKNVEAIQSVETGDLNDLKNIFDRVKKEL